MAFRNHFILLLLLFCGGAAYAQQRSEAEIEEILLNKKSLLNISQKLSLKEKSSTLLKDCDITDGKESFYVYTSGTKGKESFVIISGDKRMPAVLGYSDSNAFDPDNIPPALRHWLKEYTKLYLGTSTVNHSSTLPSSIRQDGVEPLLGTNKWGQSHPYNDKCPSVRNTKTLVGCVATAMAQVMKYHSYPERAKGNVSYTTRTNRLNIHHDFSNDRFEWNSMLPDYSGSYSDEEKDAVATLMFSCAAAVEMDFGLTNQGGSGAYQSDLLNGYIENYGYDRDAALVVKNYCSTEDWHSLLVNELNEGRPVNYAGSSIRDGGHSFVLDGYKISSNTYPDYHVNWGWNGSCDGYYQIANLHPHDGDIDATIDAFSQSQQMTIGIKPEDGVDMGRYMLLSSKLNCSLSKVKTNGTLSFNVSSLYNCSYNRFSGVISVCLIDDNGNMITLGTGNRYELKYLEGSGNQSYTCILPDEVHVGKYKASLAYRPAGSDEWRTVYSSSYPTIEVTASENVGPADEEWAEVGCSEVEIAQPKDRYTITANVYELINLQQESFKGTIQLTMADENGFPLFSFGEPLEIPELGYNDYLSEAVQITGIVDRMLSDGYYRLYVSAKKHNKNINSYVVLNDLAKPGTQTTEFFYKVAVRNGVMTIDDKQYDCLPTSVKQIKDSKEHIKGLYDIHGRELPKRDILKKGIYVDGDSRKVFLSE